MNLVSASFITSSEDAAEEDPSLRFRYITWNDQCSRAHDFLKTGDVTLPPLLLLPFIFFYLATTSRILLMSFFPYAFQVWLQKLFMIHDEYLLHTTVFLQKRYTSNKWSKSVCLFLGWITFFFWRPHASINIRTWSSVLPKRMKIR